MPSRMSRTFPQGPQVPQPDTTNRAGGAAYSTNLREEVAETLMLGTFGNTFYAKGQDLAKDAVKLLKQAVAEDPLFTAKATVMAREEGYVRSAPIISLALLTAGDQEAKDYAKRISSRVIRTGDDLRNFVSFVHSGEAGAAYGGLRRRLAADWLRAHATEYQAMKYAGSGEQFSLRNILRLTHPSPPSPVCDAVFGWLVRSTLKNAEATPQLAILEAFKAGDLSAADAIRLGSLPFETVMPRVESADASLWSALLQDAPYMFLLRSLNAMAKAGVFKSQENVAQAASILMDPERVRKSRQFPFRFLTAANALQRDRAPQPIVNAVFQALEHSVANLPEFPSDMRIAVAVDTSGSMTQASAAVAEGVYAADIAGIFAGALWKAHGSAMVLPFDAHQYNGGIYVHPLRVGPSDSVMTIARTIGSFRGGGTDLTDPITWLMQRREKVDLLVEFTDSMDWAGSGFLHAWHQYTHTIAPKAKAVLVQIVPSGYTRVAPDSYPGVRYVYGWSDQVLRLVGHAATGRTFAELVDSVDL